MADIMNTDIYDITQTVNDIQKEMMGLDDDTLAVGMNGYLSSIQSMQIQNSIVTASEMGNEIFPSKAKFEKNIIAHAITQNITDINATPATMSIMIGLMISDLEKLFEKDKFILDKECKIFIGTVEFHFQYDIVISRTLSINNHFIYSARYDMSIKNPLSKIKNPYLKTPFIQEYGGENYLFIYCDIMQVQAEKLFTKVITSTPIENKIFEFEFEHQLATFDVKVTENGKETYLTPVFEGIGVEQNLESFCYYSFIDSKNIRVRFDSISYLPKTNATIESNVLTTLGSEGNFSYTENFNTAISSDRFGYKGLAVRIMIGSDSIGGMDAKSTAELRQLIPKEALSRGSITNTTTLINYFNMINQSNNNKISIQTKVDNQFERSYFAYLVLKDKYNNVIPTNTLDIEMEKKQFQTNDNRKYALLPGTCIYYDKTINMGRILTDEKEIKRIMENDKEEFLYGLPFMVVLTDDPLYISYYSTIINYAAYLDFTYINYDAHLQFVAPSITWNREFTKDRNTYKLRIPFTQNILTDQGMLVFNSETNELIQNNMKVFAIFYNKGDKTPYRYAEGRMINYDHKTSFAYEYEIDIKTTDQIDDKNRIRMEDLYLPGTTDRAYGYFTNTVDVKIYILAKFANAEYGRYNIDEIIPGLEGYSVCNMFSINDGVCFYNNYTDLITSTVSHITTRNENQEYIEGYRIKSIPMVKYSYMDDEDCIQNFIDEIDYKKAYMDSALDILENNFMIDFKLFNTYGPSRVYSLDEHGEHMASRVNLTLNFRTRLVHSTDSYTIGYIIKDIKDILEDLNDMSSLHIPNLITTITNNYKNAIEYFEFLGINDYGPGVQHLYKNEITDVKTVPEFLTVHTNEGLTPDINIELA